MEAFNDELSSFKDRIRARAKARLDEAMAAYEEVRRTHTSHTHARTHRHTHTHTHTQRHTHTPRSLSLSLSLSLTHTHTHTHITPLAVRVFGPFSNDAND